MEDALVHRRPNRLPGDTVGREIVCCSFGIPVRAPHDGPCEEIALQVLHSSGTPSRKQKPHFLIKKETADVFVIFSSMEKTMIHWTTTTSLTSSCKPTTSNAKRRRKSVVDCK